MTEDRVYIRDLRVETRVGVTEEERSQPQVVVMNVAIAVDLKAPARSDDLSLTVDYGKVILEIADLVRRSEAKLLETIAEQVAGHIARFDPVERVTVEVMKPFPPVAENVGPVSVAVTRP